MKVLRLTLSSYSVSTTIVSICSQITNSNKYLKGASKMSLKVSLNFVKISSIEISDVLETYKKLKKVLDEEATKFKQPKNVSKMVFYNL